MPDYTFLILGGLFLLFGGPFLVFLLCAGTFGLLFKGNQQAPREAAEAKAPPEKRTEEMRPDPVAKAGPKTGKPPPSERKPSDPPVVPPPKELPKEEPLPVEVPSVALPVAPPPRALAPNRPPEGFTSDWVRCGEIETRVVGAAVRRPILTSAGKEFPAPEPLLLVWVETRASVNARKVLSRWLTTVGNYVELTDAANAKVAIAKIPSDAWLGGQLKGDHVLPPGGPGVVDVLAFKIPSLPAQELWLKLVAEHVGQPGVFLHRIPAEVWSKK